MPPKSGKARKWLVIILLVLVVLAGAAFLFKDKVKQWFFRPTESKIEISQEEKTEIEVVASRLDTPWSLAFLPGGDLLVTQRSGSLKRVGGDGKVYDVEGVRETSEGGLLGVALHPDFANNARLYLYRTTESSGRLSNAVDLYELKDDELSRKQTLLGSIPAASNHNGGGIAFGPDGKLYVTTGDAANGELAQDKNSLAGKILRLNDDGSVPADNPLGNYVWSYGHRNPQGIAWDDKGQLWAVEHGPSGERANFGGGKDELNLIEKGANYGWPVVAGDQKAEGMKSPKAHSGNDETWAPAGIAYLNGSLYFAGLRGQALYQAKLSSDNSVSLTRHYPRTYGRLRAVAVNENSLYFTTSNRDGRGNPLAEDDRIFKVKF